MEKLNLNKIVFRKAESKDKTFVNNLTKETMKDFVEQTWQTETEREKYYDLNIFKLDETMIATYENRPIGRFSFEVKNHQMEFNEIHIIKEFHKKGIGSHIIKYLIKICEEKNIPCILQVLKKNPAQNLYKAHGFETYKEDSERYYMRRSVN